MSEVKNAYKVDFNGTCGFVFGEKVMNELLAACFKVLVRNEDNLIAYEWTLNESYEEDGEQVIIDYEPVNPYGWNADRRLDGIIGSNSFEVRKCLFTDERDREEVERLCGMVARGEIYVSEVLP